MKLAFIEKASSSSFILNLSFALGLEMAQFLSPSLGCTSSIREGPIKLKRFGNLPGNKVSLHSAWWVRSVLWKIVLLIYAIRRPWVVTVVHLPVSPVDILSLRWKNTCYRPGWKTDVLYNLKKIKSSWSIFYYKSELKAKITTFFSELKLW